jgi:dihydrofolate reductase
MRIILVFVSTLDGKITRWGDPKVSSWTSEEDKKYFRKTWNEASLVVMGSNTYRAEKLGSVKDHLIIVMTRQPSIYKDKEVQGQLEFTDESPDQLASRFKNANFGTMLVVGGAQVATSFLKAELIDEIWLTIEPRIFGKGGNFVIEQELDLVLRLISCEQVNPEGTLITKYNVLKKSGIPGT